MKLRAWWSRTPDMGALGWIGIVIVGIGIGIAAVIPEGFWWGVLSMCVTTFGVNLCRMDVAKQQTRIFFAMVSPQMPGAVMVVEAQQVGQVCTAPDCRDLPPHPSHFEGAPR